MAQGFQLQFNNGTANSTIMLQVASTNDLTQSTPPPAQLNPGTRGHALYYEAGLGTLLLDVYVAGASAQQIGNIEIRFDSASTSEFPGSIYVVNFTPPLDPSTGNYIYPYLILRHYQQWPFGNITFVEVNNPSLPVDPGLGS